ncbi:MAG: hypothetical protein FWD38_05940 [Oscillospiraceae bacterium]|nr:hypothetical protein [Oscillospiraceae bacterium]
MENSLFRKSALDKISSPEQLNEYMKVAGPGVWAILAGLAVTFAAFIVWGLMGSIPETVDITGTMLSPDNGVMAVYSYLPIDETKYLQPGMKVRVSPDYAPREQYGYIYGTVKSVGSMPVSVENLRAALGDSFDMIYLPSGNVIEVVIKLEVLDGNPRWSTAKGASVEVIIGSTCLVDVITAERKPYELMFR